MASAHFPSGDSGAGGAGGDDGRKRDELRGPQQVRASDPPILPVFEDIVTDDIDRTAFNVSVGLLHYTMQQQLRTRREAEQEAEQATNEILEQEMRAPAGILAEADRSLEHGVGSSLRDLADRFNQWHGSQEVEQIVLDYDLNAISFSHFYAILNQMFSRGIDQNSFVTLFAFVSRLLLRVCAERGSEEFYSLCKKLIFWFLVYIAGRAIKWLIGYLRSSDLRNNFILGVSVGATGAVLVASAVGAIAWHYYNKG